ncbi:peptide ABC transporter [Frondihabitans sp. PAMC 28766]|uniref:ABC transporter substrate-binding protein n=1 Tax=Frondihabitans sp. PAMC 28766 TaxID=1795630 RepID=UPI00078C70A1|nr:ABC transporter substrate-binding protein [Frondihabitans sp. PAMC 28766]AMM21398.1 peptide ABC transporter [Frondihabitans sp. PAMC 28766]
MTHRISRVLAPVAALGALALVLTGCSSGSSSPASTSSTAVQKGGNVTVAISSDIGCIDPQQVGNNDDIAIARQTVASLTSQDPKTGAIKPWLATAWQINSNATSFTFDLRKGATFADGTPIDAAAVKANLAGIQALGAKASLGSSYLSGLKGVTVVDPQTVRIDFSAPSAQFLQATSTFSLGLVSTKSTTLSVADRCAGEYVGSGPFAVKSYTPNSSAVLSRVSSYDWAPPTESHTGAAYLSTVTYKVIPEAGTLTGALKSGQIDASPDVQTTDLPLFDGNGYTEINRANPGVTYNLIPNETNAVLKDQSVRVAIQKAIDRTDVAKLLTKYDKPATSVLSSSTPYFTSEASKLKADTKAARALLEADGWKVGSDGVREKDGQKLSFTVEYWQPSTEELELVQQEEKAIGVDLQLKFVTIAQWQSASASGSLDFLWGNLTRSDPDVLRTIFSTTGQNATHRAAPAAIDTLLADQASTTDTAQRQKLVTEAVEQLISSGEADPVYQLSTTIAASSTVHGLDFEGSSRLDLYNTWVSK